MTAKDAMEVAKEYLEEDSIDGAEPVVVVGKLDDEYVEVVEEEGGVVAADEAHEVEKSVNDHAVVSEPPSATLGRKMDDATTTQVAIEYPPGTTVISNQDTKDEWDTGS